MATKVIIIKKDVYCKHILNYKDDYITLAFHKGLILSLSDYKRKNKKGTFNDCNVWFEKFTPTCFEYCPHCDTEVELKTEFKMQVCPNCGKPIAPCNLCCGICLSKCPLGCRTSRKRKK